MDDVGKGKQKITTFKDLDVWKEAHKLTLLIYGLTGDFPKDEIFGLSFQLRRAVVSIESCIAEGFYRYHYKERLNFYYDSRGSVGEVEAQLIISRDLNFCTKAEFERSWE